MMVKAIFSFRNNSGELFGYALRTSCFPLGFSRFMEQETSHLKCCILENFHASVNSTLPVTFYSKVLEPSYFLPILTDLNHRYLSVYFDELELFVKHKCVLSPIKRSESPFDRFFGY